MEGIQEHYRYYRQFKVPIVKICQRHQRLIRVKSILLLKANCLTRNIQRKKEKEMAELQFAGGASGTVEKKQAISDKKAGRNDPCPCGSGKKYKKCCGA